MVRRLVQEMHANILQKGSSHITHNLGHNPFQIYNDRQQRYKTI